ncbi:MAG: SRPBCC family protein [Bdellovibrio sp.]|nr:SRPBCC family protein [Bdellovibrio sp.]
MKPSESKNIGISINCPQNKVYDYVSNPSNLPRWASGLGSSIDNVNGEWVANSPMGKIKIKFAEKNRYGVVDHNVTLESGISFYNPMRVLRNNDGCEVVFTLYRQPDMDDDKFKEDAEWIKKDLEKLKEILEGPT